MPHIMDNAQWNIGKKQEFIKYKGLETYYKFKKPNN
jgi:hypothetical protein